jgi:uncharacterized protein YjiS (DUF1127 family)
MFEKDNFIPPLSSHELHRQASIERNLVIQAYMRTAMRAAAKWLRVLVLRGRQLARGVSAERRWRRAVRGLQRLDDRTLKDIGVCRGEIEFAVRSGLPFRAYRKARAHQPREAQRSSAPPRQRAA